MPDYKKMYFNLAAKVADAIEILVEAQRQREMAYLDAERTNKLTLVDLQQVLEEERAAKKSLK